jgi:hypothetical protein
MVCVSLSAQPAHSVSTLHQAHRYYHWVTVHFPTLVPRFDLHRPLVGGFFSNLDTRYPASFGYEFIKHHPYFMPGFVSSCIAFLGLLFVYFCLDEVRFLFNIRILSNNSDRRSPVKNRHPRLVQSPLHRVHPHLRSFWPCPLSAPWLFPGLL